MAVRSRPLRDVDDRARAELAGLIDGQMSPLGLAAIDALALRPGQAVLDVGCGAGQTVLQLADRVGPASRVIGVDVGPRVLAVARARTAHLSGATVLLADAATLDLPDGSVDAVYSRFGIMFFADPVVAFSNLRRMLRHGGRIGFVCWRPMRENELDALPYRAADLAVAIDPAPFSFESSAFVDRLLRSTGFRNIAVEPFDTGIASDLDSMLKVVTRVGALGKALRETPAFVPDAAARVRAALSARERDGQVRLDAATWIVTATAA